MHGLFANDIAKAVDNTFEMTHRCHTANHCAGSANAWRPLYRLLDFFALTALAGIPALAGRFNGSGRRSPFFLPIWPQYSVRVAELFSITRGGREIHNFGQRPAISSAGLGANVVLWNGVGGETWFERLS